MVESGVGQYSTVHRCTIHTSGRMTHSYMLLNLPVKYFSTWCMRQRTLPHIVLCVAICAKE